MTKERITVEEIFDFVHGFLPPERAKRLEDVAATDSELAAMIQTMQWLAPPSQVPALSMQRDPIPAQTPTTVRPVLPATFAAAIACYLTLALIIIYRIGTLGSVSVVCISLLSFSIAGVRRQARGSEPRFSLCRSLFSLTLFAIGAAGLCVLDRVWPGSQVLGLGIPLLYASCLVAAHISAYDPEYWDEQRHVTYSSKRELLERWVHNNAQGVLLWCWVAASISSALDFWPLADALIATAVFHSTWSAEPRYLMYELNGSVRTKCYAVMSCLPLALAFIAIPLLQQGGLSTITGVTLLGYTSLCVRVLALAYLIGSSSSDKLLSMYATATASIKTTALLAIVAVCPIGVSYWFGCRFASSILMSEGIVQVLMGLTLLTVYPFLLAKLAVIGTIHAPSVAVFHNILLFYRTSRSQIAVRG